LKYDESTGVTAAEYLGIHHKKVAHHFSLKTVRTAENVNSA
jgi:hypothetical protein